MVAVQTLGFFLDVMEILAAAGAGLAWPKSTPLDLGSHQIPTCSLQPGTLSHVWKHVHLQY